MLPHDYIKKKKKTSDTLQGKIDLTETGKKGILFITLSKL